MTAALGETQPDAWMVRDKWGGSWLFASYDLYGAQCRQRKQTDEHGNVPEILPLRVDDGSMTERLARVEAEERERCAKVCEALYGNASEFARASEAATHNAAIRMAAAAIRAGK